MLVQSIVCLAIYWIFMAFAAHYITKNAFKRYRARPQMNLPAHYNGFTRRDFGQWNQQAIKKGCFTKFPIKASMLIIYLFILSLACLIRKKLWFPHWVIDQWRRNFGRLTNRTLFQLIQLFDLSTDISTPVVISNHTGIWDGNYIGSCFRALSPIAKSDVKTTPLFNAFLDYCQSIYVERSSQDSRKMVASQIKNRIKQFLLNPEKEFPILIFPEGTASNSHSVMQFKNGAFECLSPITIFSLRYQSPEFHIAQDEISTLDLVIITLCLNAKLIVKREVVCAKQGQSVIEYRERCRKRLAEMGEFQLSESNYKDYLEYVQMRKEISQTIKNK